MSTLRGWEMRVSSMGVPDRDTESPQFEFLASDVTHFGKITYYGAQACVNYVLQLKDGRRVMIKGTDQFEPVQRQLRRMAAKVYLPQARRYPGYSMVLVETKLEGV